MDVVVALIHTQGNEKRALATKKNVVIVERRDIFNLSTAVRNSSNVREDHTERITHSKKMTIVTMKTRSDLNYRPLMRKSKNSPGFK